MTNQNHSDKMLAANGGESSPATYWEGNEYLPGDPEMQALATFAGNMVRSGILPRGISNWQAALAIFVTGRELGLPAMFAAQNIAVVHGKTVLSAHLQRHLITRAGVVVEELERNEKVCHLRFTRKHPVVGREISTEVRWTMDDAVRAGLAGRKSKSGEPSNWDKYPRQMLYARAISEGARIIAPEALGPCQYNAEEMGGVVEAEIVQPTATREVPPPPPPPQPERTGPATGDLEAELKRQASTREPEISGVRREKTEGRVAKALTPKQKAVMAAVREIGIPDEKRVPYFVAVYGVDSVKKMADDMCSDFLSRAAQWKQEGGAMDDVDAAIEEAAGKQEVK